MLSILNVSIVGYFIFFLLNKNLDDTKELLSLNPLVLFCLTYVKLKFEKILFYLNHNDDLLTYLLQMILVHKTYQWKAVFDVNCH